MKALGISLAVAAIATAGFVTACFSAPTDEDEETGNASSNVESVDPLEGAYIKQGGTTEVRFVFRKGDGENTNNTFLGEIEADGDEASRVTGKVVVGRDNLGTTFTLTPNGSAKSREVPKKTAAADAGAEGGAPQDTRPLAQQAFSGKMHYLKIGKNETILVFNEANGKTAHYKKQKTWCGTAKDCAKDVQNTGLNCEGSETCSSKNTCACGSGSTEE